jgi:hypothetical protein
MDQLTAQVEEVRRQARDYDRITQNNPDSPLEVTGPNACRAVAASELFQAIWQQARDAGCTELTRIQNYGHRRRRNTNHLQQMER